MQIKAALFNQMKTDYEQISTFKAKQGMRLCSQVLNEWRSYTKYKILLNEIQEEFLQNSVLTRYASILRLWQAYSHKSQTLKKRFYKQ